MMKALVIEDTKMYQQVVNTVLSNLGVSVQLAATAEEGLQAVQEEAFDLIVLDLHLPDKDGLEVCRELRTQEQTRLLPTILLTSEDALGTLKAAYGAGVTDVMRKTGVSELHRSFTQLINRMSRQYEGRVLYVEDSATTEQLTIHLMRSLGLEVDHFSTAEAALDEIPVNDYDLIVTDIVLEGELSGLSLVRAVRAMEEPKGRLPILALSGLEDAARRVEILRLGANDYITKPIVEEEFKARIGNLITNKQLFDQVREQQHQLQQMAITDQLTGLYNRHYLHDVARKFVSNARRHQEPMSILVIDLDHFKAINDTHGHDAGDAVLSTVGETLALHCRDGDVAARFGGEEFVVLLSHCGHVDALKKGEALRGIVAELRPRGLDVTASIGVASLALDKEVEFADLFKLADEAVYKAKENGRNRVETCQ